MKFRIILITIIMIGLPLLAIHENAGTTGFSFLKVDFAARSAALGNSFTALADDANAVFASGKYLFVAAVIPLFVLLLSSQVVFLSPPANE